MSLAFLARALKSALQGPCSLGAGTMSCASFITRVLLMSCGTPQLPQSWGTDDSSWKFPQQLFTPPPPGTWLMSTTSPRTLSLALGQAPGLFTTFYLRVGMLVLCTQETSCPSQSSNRNLYLPERRQKSRQAHLSPTMAARLVHCHAIFVH